MLKQLSKDSYQVFMPDGTAMNVINELQSPTRACEFLEIGGIIYFPTSPFKRSEQDTHFLLTQHQQDASYHKNIAYRPAADKVTGVKDLKNADSETLRRIMRDYSRQAEELVNTLLSPYSGNYKLDYASYRPIEEKGRKMRLRARNDLLHVDSFPTRPTRGDRILRVFENINPDRVRVWNSTDTFESLAQQFYSERKAPGDMDAAPRNWLPDFLMKPLGLKAASGSAYDNWMLNFHNFLKENSHFQETCRKNTLQFAPGSTWLVYTDMVSHSVLSGQYALEQTFIVDYKSQVLPEKAPINILRRLYQR
jgi:hypothetical protein